MIEDTKLRSFTETGAIVTFLDSLISNMQIGNNDNLVSLALFDNDVHDTIHFTTNQTKASLLNELNHVVFEYDDSHVDYNDILHFLNNHLLKPNFDPRPTSKDVVVLFVDTYAKTQHHVLHPGVTHFQGNV